VGIQKHIPVAVPGADSEESHKSNAEHRKVETYNGSSNPDFQRAKDLVALHYDVKMKHLQRLGNSGGLDAGLQRARRDVSRVLQELGK
jgi:hypothetical protein